MQILSPFVWVLFGQRQMGSLPRYKHDSSHISTHARANPCHFYHWNVACLRAGEEGRPGHQWWTGLAYNTVIILLLKATPTSGSEKWKQNTLTFISHMTKFDYLFNYGNNKRHRHHLNGRILVKTSHICFLQLNWIFWLIYHDMGDNRWISYVCWPLENFLIIIWGP